MDRLRAEEIMLLEAHTSIESLLIMTELHWGVVLYNELQRRKCLVLSEFYIMHMAINR
jgi:hypothetical protein